MALSKHGRFIAAIGAVAAVVTVVVAAVLILGGRAGVGPLASDFGHGGEGRKRPTRCPLTGVDPPGKVPDRPALAVKVENLPEARPQVGLSWADIVYEQPV